MWRKWYTSRKASAVTFQLQVMISLRTATVRRLSPDSSSSCSIAWPNHADSGAASGSWLTKIQLSQTSQLRKTRPRSSRHRPMKSRSSGTLTSFPSVMS